MQQAKFSLSPSLLQFLGDYKHYGFRDKSDMVRTALDHLHEELEQQTLMASADLYAEVYEDDQELQTLTDSAISGWPE
jgi:hypothetical protein